MKIMKTKLSILLLLMFCFVEAQAKLSTFKNEVKDSYNFWFYEPKKESANDTIRKPLVIFLHGRSLCGNNLQRVLRYGTLDALIGGRDIGGYLLAPQNPGTAWNPHKIMKIVDWAIEKYHIDPARVYVLGMSLGGFGTLDLAAAYPDRIAAAMALCGGATSKTVGNLNYVPLWIIHGTADKAVSVNESRIVVKKMKKAGQTNLLRYDEWKGVNHSALARIFYLPETYEWLLKHSLKDNPKRVNRDVIIKPETLKSAYKDFNHKATIHNFEK